MTDSKTAERKKLSVRYGATFEDWCGRRETLTWTHEKDRDHYCRGVAPLGYRRLVEKFTRYPATD